jgi:DNA-binding NarL/FixJ family response regulator
MSNGNGTVEQATLNGARPPRAEPPPAAAAAGGVGARRFVPDPIRVLVVDDHEAVRRGVKAAIGDEPDLIAIGGAPNAEQALAATRLFVPDVAVVDYQLPDQDGLTLARRLKGLPEAPRVLIFSAYADPPLALASIIAGADGILTKAGIADGLIHAIRAVARGCEVRPPIGPAALRAVSGRLDPNDAAILGMLVHGTPPEEISRVLGISEHWLEVRRWGMLKQLTRSP